MREFSERSQQFSESLPERKERFVESLSTLIDVGVDTIDLDLIKDRLENASIQLSDGLSMRFQEQYGVHESATRTVYISEYALKDESTTTAALTHELLHLCAGKEIVQIPNPFHEFLPGEPPLHFHNLKNGFSIYKVGSRYKKFDWLDEAVTQFTTEWLTGQDSKVYWGERMVQAALSQVGRKQLSPLLFIRAYFENHDTSATPSASQPVHQELYSEIEESFAPGFLAALNRYIEKNYEFDEEGNILKDGLLEAFKQLTADWQKILPKKTE